MEHLPHLESPYKPLKAQYLGGKYDQEVLSDFSDFQQRNLSLEALRVGDYGEYSKEDIARLLQAWFYFGMLHEMLQIPIQDSDFIRTDPETSKEFITTKRLRDYLAKWKEQVEIEKSSPAGIGGRNERLIRCSFTTYNTWKVLENFTDIVGPEIELSIHLLGTCLEHAARIICEIEVSCSPWRAARNPLVTKRLVEMGWCPIIVDQLELESHVALPYFLSLLGPPKDQSHLLQGPGAPGCEVGDEGCHTKQVNNETFMAKHIIEGCKCEFVAANSDDVKRVVGEGDIPVVHLITDGGTPRLEVKALKGFMQYTAFSHV
jgi:hypothetical protein